MEQSAQYFDQEIGSAKTKPRAVWSEAIPPSPPGPLRSTSRWIGRKPGVGIATEWVRSSNVSV